MLRRRPPMTKAEERVHLTAAQAGDDAAVAELVAAQLDWLRREAIRRIATHPRLLVDDLVGAGAAALVEAISTFDLARSTRLYTHARRPVEEAMAREVAHFHAPVSVPPTTYRKVQGARRRDVHRDDEHGAETEAAAHSRYRVDPSVTRAVRAAGRWDSMDSSPADPEENWSAETARTAAVDRSEETPDGPALRTPPEVRFLVRTALLALTPRQRTVLDWTIMRPDTGRYSDLEAAQALGISRPQAQRARVAALETVREQLEDALDMLYPKRRVVTRSPFTRETEYGTLMVERTRLAREVVRELRRRTEAEQPSTVLAA